MKKIPVVQEELKAGKKTTVTGLLRVRKEVHEREEVVDEPLLEEEVEVKRVPVNRYVDGPVQVREENGTTIVPLVEEVLVVEKRLLLKEEVHLVKKQRRVHKPQRMTLRREEAVIEHNHE